MKFLSRAILMIALILPMLACPRQGLIANDSLVVSTVTVDSVPRWDTNAIEWQIAPIGESAIDSFYHYAAVSGVAVSVVDTSADQLTLTVARKYHDPDVVYRLVGHDAEGQRHDVVVPYKVWIMAPKDRGITLPVIKPYPQRYQ